MRTTSTTLSSLQSVKKYEPSELTYKHVGQNSKGGYLIDAYHNDRLLMTYDAYYDCKRDEFKLYPSKSHRMDSRTPGYHKIPNRIVKHI